MDELIGFERVSIRAGEGGCPLGGQTHRLDGALPRRDPVEALGVQPTALDAGDALGDERRYSIGVGGADPARKGVVL